SSRSASASANSSTREAWPGGVNRLWAPWRMTYVGGSSAAGGRLFCNALASGNAAKYLILERGPLAFLILNAYPYTPGHLMAVINRHVGALAEADDEELADAMALAGLATRVLSEEYRAEGFNLGVTQGGVGRGGIGAHLRGHVVARGSG